MRKYYEWRNLIIAKIKQKEVSHILEVLRGMRNKSPENKLGTDMKDVAFSDLKIEDETRFGCL